PAPASKPNKHSTGSAKSTSSSTATAPAPTSTANADSSPAKSTKSSKSKASKETASPSTPSSTAPAPTSPGSAPAQPSSPNSNTPDSTPNEARTHHRAACRGPRHHRSGLRRIEGLRATSQYGNDSDRGRGSVRCARPVGSGSPARQLPAVGLRPLAQRHSCVRTAVDARPRSFRASLCRGAAAEPRDPHPPGRGSTADRDGDDRSLVPACHSGDPSGRPRAAVPKRSRTRTHDSGS